jgi:hypothetical protein
VAQRANGGSRSIAILDATHTNNLSSRSPAAERMRRRRERRRRGLHCLMIQLRETEVDALIAFLRTSFSFIVGSFRELETQAHRLS